MCNACRGFLSIVLASLSIVSCTSSISPVSNEMDDTLPVSSFQRYPSSYSTTESCEVCGYKAIGFRYSALTCKACSNFFYRQMMSKKAHMPCIRNQQCIYPETRPYCACCRLKKCLAVGMHPTNLKHIIEEINLANEEPKEWFLLLSCETCDSKKIQDINESIQGLKSSFMQVKENSKTSAAASSKEVSENSIQRQFENDYVNCSKSLDFATKHTPSISDDTLKEISLNHSEPTSFPKDELEYNIYNYDPYSGLRRRFPICASSQSAAADHDNISFEESLQMPSVEKSAAYSSGSHMAVGNDHRLNFSSSFNLSSSPPPYVCEKIDPVDSLGENAMVMSENPNVNYSKSLDFATKHTTPSISDDALKEISLNHSEPTSFPKDELEYNIYNYYDTYSGSSGRFPICASSQSATADHVVVRNGHLLNFSSSFTLSSNPPPYVCEKIDPEDSLGENRMDTDDFVQSIDTTAFEDLLRKNS